MRENENQLSLFSENVEQDAVLVCEEESPAAEMILLPSSKERVKRKQVEAIPLRAKRDPAIELSLLPYKNKETNRNKRAFRFRLQLKMDTDCFVEHYCDSKEEALAWVEGKGVYSEESGEDRLFEKFRLPVMKDVPVDIRFSSIVAGVRVTGESDLENYFKEHPELLKALSQKPLRKMTGIDFNDAVRASLETENERKRAIAEINQILNVCRIRGMQQVPASLKYINSANQDKYLRALKGSLKQWVMPEDMCRGIYQKCEDMIPKNRYYMAVALMLTMGLSLSEVCGLRWKDLAGLCCRDPGDGPWPVPEEDILMLRIRRFCKRVYTGNEEKATKCVVQLVESINKYRLLVVPPHTKALFDQYIDCYGSDVNGNDVLIPANRKNSDAVLYSIRNLAKEVLREHGFEGMKRTVHLRSMDGVHDDREEVLVADIKAFAKTVEYWLKRKNVEDFRIRYFLGLTPVSVLDKHYWEPKVRMELLRQYGEISRWDLRAGSPQEHPVHISECAEVVEGELRAPFGCAKEVTMAICAEKGSKVRVELKERYGYDCSYTVTHSVPK